MMHVALVRAQHAERGVPAAIGNPPMSRTPRTRGVHQEDPTPHRRSGPQSPASNDHISRTRLSASGGTRDDT